MTDVQSSRRDALRRAADAIADGLDAADVDDYRAAAAAYHAMLDALREAARTLPRQHRSRAWLVELGRWVVASGMSWWRPAAR